MTLNIQGTSCTTSLIKDTQKGSTFGTVSTYAVFLGIAAYVYFKVAEGEFSSMLTIAAIFQCLALSLLGAQVFTGNVSGISAKMLQLNAIALASRLSATTWLPGYIPLDVTGDFLYQAFDALSLIMALWLIRRVINAQRESHEAHEDGLPIVPFAVVCFMLSCIFHADLDDRPLFDSLWMNCCFANTIALVPQLWMMNHRTGSPPTLTRHFVAMMGLSHMLVGMYMWTGYDEITCVPWIGSFNHAAPAIIGAHCVHLMLLGAFANSCVMNMFKPDIAKSGFESSLENFIAV